MSAIDYSDHIHGETQKAQPVIFLRDYQIGRLLRKPTLRMLFQMGLLEKRDFIEIKSFLTTELQIKTTKHNHDLIVRNIISWKKQLDEV